MNSRRTPQNTSYPISKRGTLRRCVREKGTHWLWTPIRPNVAFGVIFDRVRCLRDVRFRSDRFSNRPFRVKRFQTNHHHSSVDVAHGLVLLFGIGTRPFHHGSRRRGGTIYQAALL
jgi:hypothetical protein